MPRLNQKEWVQVSKDNYASKFGARRAREQWQRVYGSKVKFGYSNGGFTLCVYLRADLAKARQEVLS